MKALLLLFLALLCTMISCQHLSKDKSEECQVDSCYDDIQEEIVDTTPKATTIFWIDKYKKLPSYMEGKPLKIKTLKAQVDIDSVGYIKILSYVKPQPASVKKHIERCLETFRVKKMMIDSAFINPGVQYVQLRYTPSKIKD